MQRLEAVLAALDGDKNKLVIDLSCRRSSQSGSGSSSSSTWFVAMNKWQTVTEMEITQGEFLLGSRPSAAIFHLLVLVASTNTLPAPESIKMLEPYCSEFLIHAADNEGLQKGIDEDLVQRLSEWCSIPVTYAGGARTVEDLDLVKKLSRGRVDLTIGSALDVFGGSGAKFEECVAWNERNS